VSPPAEVEAFEAAQAAIREQDKRVHDFVHAAATRLEQNPEQFEAMFLLGVLLYFDGQEERSAPFMRKATALWRERQAPPAARPALPRAPAGCAARVAPLPMVPVSGERFDLLISDIVMPGGMSGVELARAARARDAHLPIVLTSGYAGDRLREGAEALSWPLLRKPFRAEQLGTAVREALERGPVDA